MKNALRNSKGFSLIELLIIIGIIGILAAIAIPSYSSFKDSAYITSMKSDFRNTKLACDLYLMDNGSCVNIESMEEQGYHITNTAGNIIRVQQYIDARAYTIVITNSKTDHVINFNSAM